MITDRAQSRTLDDFRSKAIEYIGGDGEFQQIIRYSEPRFNNFSEQNRPLPEALYRMEQIISDIGRVLPIAKSNHVITGQDEISELSVWYTEGWMRKDCLPDSTKIPIIQRPTEGSREADRPIKLRRYAALIYNLYSTESLSSMPAGNMYLELYCSRTEAYDNLLAALEAKRSAIWAVYEEELRKIDSDRAHSILSLSGENMALTVLSNPRMDFIAEEGEPDEWKNRNSLVGQALKNFPPTQEAIKNYKKLLEGLVKNS
ncbi:MAG: hypothetical protein ACOX0Z_03905 [Candidatus Nanosyncoccaceae bacterium]|jgi:hypothetical protein